MCTMNHADVRSEDAARYLLKEERDYDILERIYALEAQPLSAIDAHLVRLIRSQLEADWRTPLLAELDRLLGQYHVDPKSEI